MLHPLTKESQLELGIETKFAGKTWAFCPVLDSGNGGFGLGIACEGEPGYAPIPSYYASSDSYDEMATHADELNQERGIDPREGGRIVCSSMAAGPLAA